jgi:hypothetical protein
MREKMGNRCDGIEDAGADRDDSRKLEDGDCWRDEHQKDRR